MVAYANRWGRRPGRGLRPWLLIPKLVSVAVCFGGLVAALVVRLVRPDDVELAGTLFKLVIVPALLVAMLLGAALVWHHGPVLLRMRWLQLKLALVVVGVPGLHLFLASRLHGLRQAPVGSPAHAASATQFTIGLGVALAWALVLIFLGRHKPRLGQNWARSYRPPRSSDQPA